MCEKNNQLNWVDGKSISTNVRIKKRKCRRGVFWKLLPSCIVLLLIILHLLFDTFDIQAYTDLFRTWTLPYLVKTHSRDSIDKNEFAVNHISYLWSLSIPPKNMRKPKVSNAFRGYRKIPIAWNSLIHIHHRKLFEMFHDRRNEKLKVSITVVGLDQETFVDPDAVAIPTPTSLQRPCHCNFYFIKSRDQIPSLPNPNVNIMVVHLAFTISLNPTWTEGSANVNVENALQYQKLQKLSYYINSTYIDTCSVTSHEKNWHFLIIFAFACKAKSFGIAFLFFVFLECFFTFVSENVNQDARDQYRTNFVGNTGK